MIIEEFKAEILNVPGRMYRRIPTPDGSLWRNQSWMSESRATGEKDHRNKPIRIHCTIRFDDECGNGHQSFSITGETTDGCCGCIHELIAEHFPELEPLIKWHLVDTDGPMHYVANATYHASDLDYNGHAKGEADRWEKAIKFDDVPISHVINEKFWAFLLECKQDGSERLEVIEVVHVKDPKTFSPNYTVKGFEKDWAYCPFNNKTEAHAFVNAMENCTTEFVTIPTHYREGKERDLDAARSCAVWPEATDEQLCLPKSALSLLLVARLPAMLEEFNTTMVAIGFSMAPELETS